MGMRATYTNNDLARMMKYNHLARMMTYNHIANHQYVRMSYNHLAKMMTYNHLVRTMTYIPVTYIPVTIAMAHALCTKVRTRQIRFVLCVDMPSLIAHDAKSTYGSCK